MRIQLRVEAVRSRPEAVLRFRVVEADTGAPITDLQPYLGAAGHVLIVSPDLTHSVHAHPDGSGSGPDLDVHAVFPGPGAFKLWIQVQRGGKVVSAPFTVRIRCLKENWQNRLNGRTGEPAKWNVEFPSAASG